MASATWTTPRASVSPTPGMLTRAWQRLWPQQAVKLLHGQQNIVYHEPGLRLHQRLAGLLPGGPWQAVPGQLRRPRPWRPPSSWRGPPRDRSADHRLPLRLPRTHRPIDGAHHRQGGLPRPPSSRSRRPRTRPTCPYCFRAPGGSHDPADCTCDWEERLDLLFHQVIEPDRVAAIIVEPVIGEGGYIVPPPTFLPRLREITAGTASCWPWTRCSPGFGRTGRFFAVEHVGVEPDILIMAKGIASGLPLSGLVGPSRAVRCLGSRPARRDLRWQCRRLRRGAGHPGRHRG